MQLITKYNNWIRSLLCAIDLFRKYGQVVPLKDKKGVTIVNAFQSILDSSQRKPNVGWSNNEFYNSTKMLKRQWHWYLFYTKWRKIFSCWKIY